MHRVASLNNSKYVTAMQPYAFTETLSSSTSGQAAVGSGALSVNFQTWETTLPPALPALPPFLLGIPSTTAWEHGTRGHLDRPIRRWLTQTDCDYSPPHSHPLFSHAPGPTLGYPINLPVTLAMRLPWCVCSCLRVYVCVCVFVCGGMWGCVTASKK